MAKFIFLLLFIFFQSLNTSFGQYFPDASEPVPTGYQGKVFHLSQSYPACMPANVQQPWMKIDYKKEPLKYVAAVYAYILDGNKECNWVVQKNKVRKWYHVPWMHWNSPMDGKTSREFINGLTRERDSKPYELSDTQFDFKQNWGIGIYNQEGGYTIGQVWKDPQHPDPVKAKFPIGTVCAKLLFTEADSTEVPFLKGSPVWYANVNVNVNERNKKAIKPLRLIQFDIAVRDQRADNETGWVFGTLVYDGSILENDPWARMIPLGAIWGNDAGILPSDTLYGATLKESYINSAYRAKFKFGWAGRLNGPVDNPSSSCISCHGTSQYPMISSQAPSEKASIGERKFWFQKSIKSGRSFTNNAISLDYSMQLAVGIENFYSNKALDKNADRSLAWKNRISRFVSGGYALVLIILIFSFYLISKYSKAEFINSSFANNNLLLFLLRLGVGSMLLVHGFSKISGGPATWLRLGQTMGNLKIYFYPELFGFMASFAEFGGGIMMISGLFFRPVMFMLCIHISIACIKHYLSGDTIEIASHAVELLFVFLFLFLSGPGTISLARRYFSNLIEKPN